jgi:hypothetical protein
VRERTPIWDAPQDGDTVSNCLELRGSVPDGLAEDQTILIGDRGVESDHWSFRYGGVRFDADRIGWQASWTLGSLTNRVDHGDYDLVAIAMSDKLARSLSTQAAVGRASWEAADIPVSGVTGKSIITVTRRFDRSTC